MDVSDRRMQVQLTQEARIASDFSYIRAILAVVGFVSALRRKNKSFRPSCRSLYRCVMDVILPTKFVLPSVHSSRFVLYCLAGGFL